MNEERLKQILEEQKNRVCVGYPCPNCGEYGGIYAVKNKKTKTLWAYCDECDTLWENLEDVKNNLWVEDSQKQFEWGGFK